MKKNHYTKWLRTAITACLVITVFTASSMVALGNDGKKSLTGEISVSGKNSNGGEPFVLLNGDNALTGRTFFSNGTISTPEGITSTIKLGKLGYVILSPKTTLTLSFDEKSISGTLSAGNVEIFNAEGISVNIQKIGNAAAVVKPLNKQQDDDDDDNAGGIFGGDVIVPVIVFAGMVGGAALVAIYGQEEDNITTVSPVR